MRFLLFAITTLFFSTVFSQLNLTQGVFQVDCDEVVFDDGGPAGQYSNGLSDTMTLVFPSYVTNVILTFPFWDMEASDWDTLSIYSGTATAPNLIGHYATASPPTLTVANDTIILVLDTDVATVADGFEINFFGIYEGGSAVANDVTCSTVSNGSIAVTASGGDTPYLFSIDSANTWQASNTFTGLSAGTYDDLLIRDQNGCRDTIDVLTLADISIPFSFDIETVSDISCNGLTDGSVAVTISGSQGGNYDFAWSTGFDEENVTNSAIINLAQGSYSLTVSDALDTACLTTVNYAVDEPALLTETHFILDTISCNNNCDGSIAFTAAGGVPPYQYSGDGGTSFQASSVLDSLCAGTINYEIEDANGCSVSGSQNLVEPAALTVGTSGTDPSGAGTNDGSVNSTPAGGTTPYTYLWNTSPVQTGQNATGLSGGTYTVTVTDSNGCTAQATEVLFEPALFDGGVIEFAAGSNFYELICHGSTSSNIQNRTLASGGTGGINYRWQWSTDLSNWNTFGVPTTPDYGTYTPTQDVFIRRMAIDATPDTSYSNALTINYVEEVFPVITGLDTSYCQNDPFVVMNGSPSSGTSFFTLNGFDTITTNLSYSPLDTILQDTSYNIDTSMVSYTYVDNNGCTFTSPSFEFYIYDTVTFDLEFFQTEYILGEANVYLPGKVSPYPTGGSGYFEGPGASGDSLYLDVAGLGGNKSYRFTYTDTTGCVSTDTDSINIVSASAVTGLGDALFCNTEGLVPVSATDPNGSVPQPWTPSTPNYPGPALTYNSGFRLFDSQGNNISATALASGGASACCSVTDNDVIDLGLLPVTPGQFLDTFRLQYRYENKVQSGIYMDQICYSVPFVGSICIPYPYPTYTKVTYFIDRFFYVEHLNSAGSFSNLTPPYCANINPVNIVAENQDPLGGISEWSITGVPAFTNDGLTNANQTTVTFDPGTFDGAQDVSYTINYLYKSPLEQCQMSLNGAIEVSSVPLLQLSQNTTPGAIPLDNELCLGLIDTVYGFAGGSQVGDFSGNNVNNGTANDGFAILNTSTGPVINEPITFTYTDANGCVVDSSWLFTVHDEPVVSIITANNDICFGDSVLLEGLGDGSPGVGNFYTNDGITDTTVAGEAWFNSNFASPDSNYLYTYEFTDLNGCTNSISDYLYVNDLPVAGVNIDGYEFCSNDTANVNAIPLPGPDDSLFFNGIYEPYDPTGFYEIIAGNYPNGIINVQYFYVDNNGCKAFGEDSMLVYPTPSVGFTFNSNCITDTIDFVDTTLTNGASIADYSWTFSDGFASSAQDTSVLFQAGGQKVITFEVTSTAGCSDSYQLIEWFGEKPRVDFDWTNECLIGGLSNTQFVNNTPSIDSVTIWNWSFGDLGNTTSNQFEPLFDYTQNGSYLVTLIGETDYGCIDTAMKAIWIRDYVQSYPYYADFETGNFGWVPDTLVGVNNSWEWGTPNGTVIDSAFSGSNVLMTSLNDNHNNQEFSFIISPCFDFSQLKRPMIKIKLWGETNQGDGMKIEYGDQGADYHPLGTVGKGINWYDDFVTGLIEADPNNTTSPEGWFGSTGGWVDARYQLDTVRGDSMVRFKIIFGSDVAQTLDGFAIDDIWIGERERTVLVEHFTNYNDPLSQVLTPFFNGKIDNPYLNDYSLDLVNLQYHIRQTSTELLNTNYASGPAARQNYYGLDSIPYVINDGISFRGDVNDWYNNIEKLEARTLVDPQFDIDLNLTQTNADLDIQVDFWANEDLGNKEVVVRIAVIEDSVDLSGFGVNGVHRNTLLDFIPGASGTSFTNNWTVGTSGSLFESTTVTNGFNLNNIDVVVWIQEKDSKEVYQAISGKVSSILGLTGVHDETASMDFIIYPNPTMNQSTLLLNNAFDEKGEVFIHDASGRLIEKIEIHKFQENINLANQNYKNGLYFVSVVNPKGQKMTKKMIVQKN